MSATTIEADVCIVGAGPAGIAVAHELRNSSLSVTLLESGAIEHDQSAQDLSEGDVIPTGFGAHALALGRRRQFGGSSNLWLYRTLPDDGLRYARSVPPQGIDLSERPGLPGSGWPFDVAALRPYQERAQRFWNDAEFDYEPGRWSTGRMTALGEGNGPVTLAIAQHGSREVFSRRYLQDLMGSERVQVVTGTTAEALTCARDGTVIGVDARTTDGQPVRVLSRIVVLAAGGVENAQLLLASFPAERGHPANRHGVVGRYLTDHPEFRIGYLTLDRSVDPYAMADFDVRWVGPTMVSAFLTLDEGVKRSEHLLNLSAALVGQPPGLGTETHRTIYSMFSGTSGRTGPRLAGSLAGLARHPGELARYARSRLARHRFHEFSGGWSTRPGLARTFEVHVAAEQMPDPDNRVTLSRREDRFGRRRLQLAWTWSQADRENVSRSLDLISDGIATAGLGTLHQWIRPGRDEFPAFTGLHHPMGATRIGHDPTMSVVDDDCRVHGTGNVYVAGSSVFPNGHGYANPTLTILALAMRLADRIRGEHPAA